MNGLLIVLPAALLVGALFVWLFMTAASHGQFEDLDDPPLRMLMDDADDAAAGTPGHPGPLG
jgi:cbb3-type cytochrome oxidase maturation protein